MAALHITGVSICTRWSHAVSHSFASPSAGRREFLTGAGLAGLLAEAPQVSAKGFQPSDITGAAPEASPSTFQGRVADPDKLQEALYLISRVQEATAQQERLVTTGKFKDVQRNNIRKAINMMLDNYRLGDQIVAASAYVEPNTNVMKASGAGNEAIDTLETAKEYFSKDLKVAALTDEQRKFIVQAMQTTRLKLDNFLGFFSSDTVRTARKRVEDENAKNMAEFVGENGTSIINPVSLPWKS